MLCSCLYIQRWKRRLQMLVAVDPTSTHEITTPVFRPSSWMNPNFSNGHNFRILSYGRDVTKGNKNSMKISVLSTHHPSTAVLSWLPVPFGWRRETKNSMKKCVLSRYHPSIVVRSFVRGACSHFTLASEASNVFRGSRRFRHSRQ
jgi:hypothetical protein